MYQDAVTTSKLERIVSEPNRWLGVLCGVSAALAAAAVLSPGQLAGKALFSASAAMVVLCIAMVLIRAVASFRERNLLAAVTTFIASERHAALLADKDGNLVFQNDAASARFGDSEKKSLIGALNRSLADPASVTRMLQARAVGDLDASEVYVTANGKLRVAAQRVGARHLLWRIEDIATPTKVSELPDDIPTLVVSASGKIQHVNASAHEFIGRKVATLDRLFKDLPVSKGGVYDIDKASGSAPVFVWSTEKQGGDRTVCLFPMSPDDCAKEDWNAFQNLPVPLLKVGADGNVVAFNAMASSLVGVTLVPGLHLSEFMEGLGRSISDWLSETLAGRAKQHSEFLRLKRMDKEVFVQVTLNRIVEAGAPTLIAVLNDATELKSLEAQFVQSQKMQAIGQLAGGVAHDFNNLLTAISGHCDLLLLRHDQGDPDFGDLVQINQNANRAAALVGQLLAFSRKQTLRPETLDMRDTLSDLTHLLNRLVGEKVKLTLSHDPVLAPIRADKRQLEQVLMNLVVNARDAMPNGGEIRIETQDVHLTTPLKRDRVAVPAGDYVAVKVSDEGVGIPSDKLQKVFEPFFTTKRTGEGTGLGLSTAYGIVKQTGGYIFVDSVVGSGARFTLYFPVLDIEEQPKQKSTKVKTKSVGKHGDGVILLVEDEAPVRAFASRALRLRGYTVIEADSAEAALKTLEDKTLSVDVFVTDVVMPGMDGPSWVQQALRTRPDVRVVFVSGYAEDSFGETQMKIPNSVFLPKPFSLNDLTETVHKQLQ